MFGSPVITSPRRKAPIFRAAFLRWPSVTVNSSFGRHHVTAGDDFETEIPFHLECIFSTVKVVFGGLLIMDSHLNWIPSSRASWTTRVWVAPKRLAVRATSSAVLHPA